MKLSVVTTTCDCLTVTTSRGTIAPGETVEATVRADFTHDPDFSGSLSMEAMAHAKGSKAVAFTLGVDVMVE